MRRATTIIPYTLWNGSSSYKLWGLDDQALVISHNHIRENGVWTSGGPFFVRKRLLTLGVSPILQWRRNGFEFKYTPFVGQTYFPSPPEPQTASQLRESATVGMANAGAFGATGWKRTRPGNPVSNLATSVAELKDFLPNLPRRLYNGLQVLLKNKQQAKNNRGPGGLGDAYLNVQFGWIPLLTEIRSMYDTYRSLDRRLAQIYRDNGKGIHRSTVIRDTNQVTKSTSVSDVPFATWHGEVPPTWVFGRSVTDTTTVNVDRVWFAGRYRYYIPDIGSSEWSRRTTRALFGANVTPEVVWNVLPWSWLFDWFGNVGDMMSNASSNAVDNLIADYAFVMRHVETRTSYDATCRWDQFGEPSGSNWIPSGVASASASDSLETKARVAASPFGFGLTWDGLSPYQVGIAAALGISRWA